MLLEEEKMGKMTEWQRAILNSRFMMTVIKRIKFGKIRLIGHFSSTQQFENTLLYLILFAVYFLYNPFLRVKC